MFASGYVGDRRLIKSKDEHFYMTTTPLQLRDACQRMIVNIISIGGSTTKFKSRPILKHKNTFTEVKPSMDYKIAKGVHTILVAKGYHEKVCL